MKFGLFGSAQARRAGPDTDSSQGFRDFIDNNVEAEALGYYSTFLVEHHFTGFGQVSASLNLLTWLGARTRTFAPRHRGSGIAVAQPCAARRAGGDARSVVRRAARFRRRQRLSLERVRRLLRADGGGRRALRGGARRDHQVLCLGDAVLAIAANTGDTTTSSSSRRPRRSRIRRSGWAPAAPIRCARSQSAATTCCWGSTRSPKKSSSRSRSSRRKSRRAAAASTRWRSRSPAPCISPKTPPTRRPPSNAAIKGICASTRWRAGRARNSDPLHIG